MITYLSDPRLAGTIGTSRCRCMLTRSVLGLHYSGIVPSTGLSVCEVSEIMDGSGIPLKRGEVLGCGYANCIRF